MSPWAGDHPRPASPVRRQRTAPAERRMTSRLNHTPRKRPSGEVAHTDNCGSSRRGCRGACPSQCRSRRPASIIPSSRLRLRLARAFYSDRPRGSPRRALRRVEPGDNQSLPSVSPGGARIDGNDQRAWPSGSSPRLRGSCRPPTARPFFQAEPGAPATGATMAGPASPLSLFPAHSHLPRTAPRVGRGA